MKNWFELIKRAGYCSPTVVHDEEQYPAELVRLCELVAEEARREYEREHCRHVVPLPDALQAMIDAEREACAKVCEQADADCHGAFGAHCAAAIRARSDK